MALSEFWCAIFRATRVAQWKDQWSNCIVQVVDIHTLLGIVSQLKR